VPTLEDITPNMTAEKKQAVYAHLAALSKSVRG